MPEKFSLTGSASGLRIPIGPSYTISAVMALVGVSQEDAQWLVDSGQWAELTSRARQAVIDRRVQREVPVSITGDAELPEDPGGQVEIRGD